MPILNMNLLVIVSKNKCQLLNTIYLPILEKVLTHVLKGFEQYTNRYQIEKYSNICLFYNCYV